MKSSAMRRWHSGGGPVKPLASEPFFVRALASLGASNTMQEDSSIKTAQVLGGTNVR